jgi:hypothetical protein
MSQCLRSTSKVRNFLGHGYFPIACSKDWTAAVRRFNKSKAAAAPSSSSPSLLLLLGLRSYDEVDSLDIYLFNPLPRCGCLLVLPSLLALLRNCFSDASPFIHPTFHFLLPSPPSNVLVLHDDAFCSVHGAISDQSWIQSILH